MFSHGEDQWENLLHQMTQRECLDVCKHISQKENVAGKITSKLNVKICFWSTPSQKDKYSYFSDPLLSGLLCCFKIKDVFLTNAARQKKKTKNNVSAKGMVWTKYFVKIRKTLVWVKITVVLRLEDLLRHGCYNNCLDMVRQESQSWFRDTDRGTNSLEESRNKQ